MNINADIERFLRIVGVFRDGDKNILSRGRNDVFVNNVAAITLANVT